MAFNRYRFTLKSEEIAGAGAPNIIYVGLASDADAAIFQSNLELLFAAKCVTVDKEILVSYELNYPAGTNRLLRLALRDAVARVQIARFYNVASGTTAAQVATAYTSNNIVLVAPVAPGSDPNLNLPPYPSTTPALVTSVTATDFTRTVSF